MFTYRKNFEIPTDVTRVIFVRNLPYAITGDHLYKLFAKYGAIRQIRIGNASDTKGTAYVVYEDIFDARTACEHLSGYNMQGRYLILLFHHEITKSKEKDTETNQEEESTIIS
eukprot:gnl/MRDRNA2_/MRDRNA2_59995_c0_seq1.p1 gnl/MRDRNA2_/MRDRNA2_59995_c0~~gnl/MRDRNA2_/MRDRNA2_59995_c0_seq1.p1  ORF type:complete len:113 (-),score=1.47 gnl/MRDRNA2_/MRDRNA2_59995_c0_seq1:67-405(-)